MEKCGNAIVLFVFFSLNISSSNISVQSLRNDAISFNMLTNFVILRSSRLFRSKKRRAN